MTMRFDVDGFAVLPALLHEAEMARVEAWLAQRPQGAAREPLDEPWCAELARRLQAEPRLAGAIPATHVPVQCTPSAGRRAPA